MKNTIIKNCPCGRAKTYADCCEIIHNDIFKALTAEDVMRSRYTAFVLALGDYLMLSQHSSTRDESEKSEIIKWAKSMKWKGLEVVNSTKGLSNDLNGTVEFKAHFKDRFVSTYIHENSAFVRENGHWVYLVTP